MLAMILMAILATAVVSASPPAIDPVMVVDTMPGAGAVISAAAVAAEPQAPRILEAVVVLGVIALASLAVVAALYYIRSKPKDGARLSRRTLHYARDQPVAAT